MPTLQRADTILAEARLRHGLPIHNHTIGHTRTLPVVRIQTGAFAGFGEGPALPTFTGCTPEATFAVIRSVLPELVGRTLPAALDWIHEPGRVADPQARAAIDIALHDLGAKHEGVPLHRYLGGDGASAASTNGVRVSRAIGLHPPERVVELGRAYVDKGVTSLKLKVGRGAALDAEVLMRLRDAVGGSVEIALDANESYDVEGAAALWSRAAAAAPAYFEQPLPRDDVAGARRLRATGIPVVADESVFGAADVARLAKREALDGVVVKLVKCGGLRPGRAMAHEALAHGLPVMIVDPLGSAISLLAGLHLAATLPVMPYAHGLSAAFDVDAPHAPHTPVRDGHQAPPARAGLGAHVQWPSEAHPQAKPPSSAERTTP